MARNRRRVSRGVLDPETSPRCDLDGCNRFADPDMPVQVCHPHAYVIAECFAGLQFKSGPIRQAVVRQKAKDTGGWIYYLRLGDRIKIGHTVNLKQRLAAYPPDAKLLAAHPGSRADEAALHQLFQSYLATGREWYGQHGPILDHIAKAIREHGHPDALALTPKRTRRPGQQVAAIGNWSGKR